MIFRNQSALHNISEKRKLYLSLLGLSFFTFYYFLYTAHKYYLTADLKIVTNEKKWQLFGSGQYAANISLPLIMYQYFTLVQHTISYQCIGAANIKKSAKSKYWCCMFAFLFFVELASFHQKNWFCKHMVSNDKSVGIFE